MTRARFTPRHQAGGLQSAGHRRAFTLLELLVVIGVIAILAGILIPTLAGVVRSGRESAQRQALAGIDRALDAYRGDHDDIPRFSDATGDFNDADEVADRGARLLARALFGPAEKDDPNNVPDAVAWRNNATSIDKADYFQDGFSGFGFKAQRQVVPDGSAAGGATFYLPGQTYGPYLEPDRWDLDDFDGNDASFGERTVLLDNNGLPILYYPARREPPPPGPIGPGFSPGGTYVRAIPLASANPPVLFNSSDNALFPANPAGAVADTPVGYATLTAAEAAEQFTFFRSLIGDSVNGTTDQINGDGTVDSGNLAVDRPYLLIATGPRANGRSGLPDPATAYDEFQNAAGWEYARDAVTNFDDARP